jgi:putative ABC transport system ATP-binding protein
MPGTVSRENLKTERMRAHGTNVIELSDVERSFEEGRTVRSVLRGVNLSIREGDFCVLLGRSGSGKSTLLNLISGIDRPTEGDVRFRGQSLAAMNERERTLFRRKHIGFVFQSFNLIPTLTVRENVSLPLELNGLLDAAGKRRVGELLEEVGLEDRRDSYPDRLSGGEQQRVAVARALIHDPELLLADEPTGNLDFETARDVLDLIERLVHARRRTMIVATHDRDLRALADRVLTLQRGVIVESAAESVRE